MPLDSMFVNYLFLFCTDHSFSKHVPAQSYQQKHCSDLTVQRSGVLITNFGQLHIFSSVSIFDFEQVNVCWADCDPYAHRTRKNNQTPVYERQYDKKVEWVNKQSEIIAFIEILICSYVDMKLESFLSHL